LQVILPCIVQLGRLPIELAAKRDCKEEVEMLFPLTSAIPNVPNWSIEGVISHAKFEEKKPMVSLFSYAVFVLNIALFFSVIVSCGYYVHCTTFTMRESRLFILP
jgi:hypothetical protein